MQKPANPTVQLGDPINRGLIAAWLFTERAGITTYDVSKQKQNGTLIGGPTWVAGRAGPALSFNGTSQYVSVPYTALNSPASLTVSCWYSPADFTSTRGTLFGRWFTGGVWGYYLQKISDNAFRFYYHLGSDLDWTPSFRFVVASDVGKWFHFALSYDNASGVVAFYANGKFDSSSNIGTGAISAPTSPFGIGAFYNNGAFQDFLNGRFDDVRLYNRPLAASEIGRLAATDYREFRSDIDGAAISALSAGAPATSKYLVKPLFVLPGGMIVPVGIAAKAAIGMRRNATLSRRGLWNVRKW